MNTFQYTPEMVDCKYCTEFVRKQLHCNHVSCPWLSERIEAGVVGCKEAVREICYQEVPLRYRLRSLITHFPNSFWIDHQHRNRMEYLNAVFHFYRKRNTPKWYAVLYLVSSSAELCNRMMNCFTREGIDFRKARFRGITSSDYALLKAAETIYTGEEKITVGDLASREIIDSKTFRLIINAQLIARHGLPVLEITSKDGVH